MTTTTALDALEPRWSALCARVGRRGDPALLFHHLRSLYAFPPRQYHNLNHIAACLQRLDETPTPRAVNRDAVEFALWLHDAVYVPGRVDNEKRSAAVAAMLARELGCPAPFIKLVKSCILATRHDAPAPPNASPEERLAADIDLAILGADRDTYRGYVGAVRDEHWAVPFDRYAAARREFLGAMLARPHMFNTPALRKALEPRARENIAAELAYLAPADPHAPAQTSTPRNNPFPGYSGPDWR